MVSFRGWMVAGIARRVRARFRSAFAAAAVLAGAAALATGLAGAPQARAEPGDGLASLRAAVQSFADGLPAPTTAAERKLAAKLAKALELLGVAPGSLADEVRAAAAGYRKLPDAVLDDPEVAGVLDVLIAAFGADLAAALDDLDAAVLALGDSPKLDGIRAAIAKAREKLAPALAKGATDDVRMKALDAAAKKLAAAQAKLDAFEETASDCGNLRTVGDPRKLAASLDLDESGPVALTDGQDSAGSGSDAFGDFGGTVYGGFGTHFFYFSANDAAVATGPVTIVQNALFETGVQVRFQKDGVGYQADTGTFTIESIRVRRYAKPAAGTPKTYLEVKGAFSGSGYGLTNPMLRASADVEFDFCEIPYVLR